jgi:molecular chaperone Hsp33
VDVDCEFCNRHYHLDRIDAIQLFADTVTQGPSGTRH